MKKSVRCLIKYGDKILLAKRAAEKYWTLPGGAVEESESLENAALREVKEEVGIKLNKIILLGSYQARFNGEDVTVSAFKSSVESPEYKPDGYEMETCGWFGSSEFPQPLSWTVNKVLDLERKTGSV